MVSGSPPSTTHHISKRHVVYIGLMISIATAVANAAVSFILLFIWAEAIVARYDVRLDFGTSGLLWITTSIGVFNLLFVGPILILVNCITLPFFIKRILSNILVGVITLTLIDFIILTTTFVFTSIISIEGIIVITGHYNSTALVIGIFVGTLTIATALFNYLMLVLIRRNPEHYAEMAKTVLSVLFVLGVLLFGVYLMRHP